MVIPFLSQVKVRSICVISKNDVSFASKMRLYVNEENVNFSLVEQNPIQEFPLFPNLEGEVHNAVKVNKFSQVYKLLIHLVNPNVEKVDVAYIQIKGENTNLKRKPVTAVYEVKPNAEKKDIGEFEKNAFGLN